MFSRDPARAHRAVQGCLLLFAVCIALAGCGSYSLRVREYKPKTQLSDESAGLVFRLPITEVTVDVEFVIAELVEFEQAINKDAKATGNDPPTRKPGEKVLAYYLLPSHSTDGSKLALSTVPYDKTAYIIDLATLPRGHVAVEKLEVKLADTGLITNVNTNFKEKQKEIAAAYLSTTISILKMVAGGGFNASVVKQGTYQVVRLKEVKEIIVLRFLVMDLPPGKDKEADALVFEQPLVDFTQQVIEKHIPPEEQKLVKQRLEKIRVLIRSREPLCLDAIPTFPAPTAGSEKGVLPGIPYRPGGPVTISVDLIMKNCTKAEAPYDPDKSQDWVTETHPLLPDKTFMIPEGSGWAWIPIRSRPWADVTNTLESNTSGMVTTASWSTTSPSLAFAEMLKESAGAVQKASQDIYDEAARRKAAADSEEAAELEKRLDKQKRQEDKRAKIQTLQIDILKKQQEMATLTEKIVQEESKQPGDQNQQNLKDWKYQLEADQQKLQQLQENLAWYTRIPD